MDEILYEKNLIDILKKFNFQYTKIENEDILKIVFELFNDNKIVENDDNIYLYYRGVYEFHYCKNNETAEKYFLMAIEKK